MKERAKNIYRKNAARSVKVINTVPLANKVPMSFYKFFISGVTAFIADTIVLNIFIHFVFGEDIRFLDVLSVSKFIAASVGIVVGFVMNRNWSFRHKKDTAATKNQAMRYGVVFVVNLVLASLIFPLYKDLLTSAGIPDELTATAANILTTSNIMFVSYSLYRVFVFK